MAESPAMRIDRFTQRMHEALPSAQSMAADRSHAEFDNEHFLLSLLDQPEGIATPLLEKVGVNLGLLRGKLTAALTTRAQAHGLTAQTNPAAALVAILEQWGGGA